MKNVEEELQILVIKQNRNRNWTQRKQNRPHSVNHTKLWFCDF